jgi:hypothetical protein
VEHLKGKGGEQAKVVVPPVSIKDRVILALMDKL